MAIIFIVTMLLTFSGGVLQTDFAPRKKVLDAGCGSDIPLPRLLSAGQGGYIPSLYVGVDYGPIKRKFNATWCHLFENTDFIAKQPELIQQFGGFDVATSFEVIEHVPIDMRIPYLYALRASIYQGGYLLISTPVFNGKAAKNHIGPEGIREMTIPQLHELLTASGFTVVARHGTFASWHDIQRVATDSEKELIAELAKFHSNDVLSCFLAPKYPDQSRNNIWICQ
jgi:SAM-dependent methyltransferase